MIGRIDPRIRRAVVVGGGFSGLLAAYRLERAGHEVVLIEASNRLGGLIQSRHSEHGLIESAAHSFLATPEVENLCHDLGVELAPVREDSKARFIHRGGRARKIPLGLPALFGVLRRALFVRAAEGEGELSVAQWAERHLGRGAVDWLLNPGLRGIYAARPEELTIGAAFPKVVGRPGESLFRTMLRRRRESRALKGAGSGGSVARGASGGMKVPVRGVQALTDAMANVLRRSPRVRVLLETSVLDPARDLAEFGEANWIFTVPASVLGRMLVRDDIESSRSLDAVPYAPLVSVTAFVSRASVPKWVRGVGVLVPELEPGRDALGVLMTSSPFPGRVVDEARLASFTLILGGTSRPEILGWSDEQIRATVDRELLALLGIRDGVQAVHAHRWQAAIPVYGPELTAAWEKLRAGYCAKPGRVVFGNHAGEVSIRGMIEKSLALSAVD